MLNKPISKILLSVLFRAVLDFVAEVNEERKRSNPQTTSAPMFSKVLVNKSGGKLWYAPQTGKKTQAKLKREANKLQKQVSKTANNFYTTAEEIANEAAERANGLSEQGREFVEEKASTLKKVVAR